MILKFTVATIKIAPATSGEWCSTACDHIQFFLGNLGQYFLLCQTILKKILSDVGLLELFSIHIHKLHQFIILCPLLAYKNAWIFHRTTSHVWKFK